VITLGGTGVAGFANGSGETARFHSPTDVLVDAEGTIVIADFANHRIRSLTPVN
jgi:hypothetical protein